LRHDLSQSAQPNLRPGNPTLLTTAVIAIHADPRVSPSRTPLRVLTNVGTFGASGEVAFFPCKANSTVVVLTTNQMLSQLAAHISAALNVGVTPVEVREAVYECAPFIGFPATLNAMATVNEVFRDRGIELPLPSQATVGEADRYDQGRAIQFPIYGDEIRDNLAAPPDGLGDALARFLTEFCFGDFSTRTGLDQARRELLNAIRIVEGS
jgi:alkylhydroperoxidase/carboxymuconolactone decarboxylase family protein YurZ